MSQGSGRQRIMTRELGCCCSLRGLPSYNVFYIVSQNLSAPLSLVPAEHNALIAYPYSGSHKNMLFWSYGNKLRGVWSAGGLTDEHHNRTDMYACILYHRPGSLVSRKTDTLANWVATEPELRRGPKACKAWILHPLTLIIFILLSRMHLTCGCGTGEILL